MRLRTGGAKHKNQAYTGLERRLEAEEIVLLVDCGAATVFAPARQADIRVLRVFQDF